MSISTEQVTEALRAIVDPNTGKDFVSTRSARNIRVDGGDVSLEVELGYPARSQFDPIRNWWLLRCGSCRVWPVSAWP